MITKSDKWNAFKEACADTAIGSIINIPLNFVMISLAFYWGLSAAETTAFMTVVFTIIALSRKTYIRLHFQRRYQKNLSNTQESPK